MTHTLGPWEVREDEWRDQKVIAPPGSYALAMVLRQRDIAGVAFYDASANAALIAAAPELLEACKGLLGQLPNLWGDYVTDGKITVTLNVDVLDDIENAITKSVGVQ